MAWPGWNPLVSLLGRDWEQPSAPGQEGPGRGSSPCAGREEGPCSQSSWPFLPIRSALSSPSIGRAPYPSFLFALLVSFSWCLKTISHLCSQSAGGTSVFVSNIAAVALAFQKGSGLSLGMQGHFPLCLLGAQRCVAWKGWDWMLNTTGYFTEMPKKDLIFRGMLK